MDAKQFNLQELVVALSQLEEPAGKDQALRPVVSKELQDLLVEGLHHAHLPEALRDIKAAEAMQLIFEATGGIARGVLWADRNYSAFMKLYARQTIPTIAPVLPQPELRRMDEWPPWVTARRLAYQESSTISKDIVDQVGNPNPGDSDAVGGE